MNGSRVVTPTIALACLVAGCGGSERSPDGSDGAAVAACRSSLQNVANDARLATTVRADGDGYVVSAWTTGRPEGVPDYVCNVARDRDAERGVSVVHVRPSPAR